MIAGATPVDAVKRRTKRSAKSGRSRAPQGDLSQDVREAPEELGARPVEVVPRYKPGKLYLRWNARTRRAVTRLAHELASERAQAEGASNTLWNQLNSQLGLKVGDTVEVTDKDLEEASLLYELSVARRAGKDPNKVDWLLPGSVNPRVAKWKEDRKRRQTDLAKSAKAEAPKSASTAKEQVPVKVATPASATNPKGAGEQKARPSGAANRKAKRAAERAVGTAKATPKSAGPAKAVPLSDDVVKAQAYARRLQASDPISFPGTIRVISRAILRAWKAREAGVSARPAPKVARKRVAKAAAPAGSSPARVAPIPKPRPSVGAKVGQLVDVPIQVVVPVSAGAQPAVERVVGNSVTEALLTVPGMDPAAMDKVATESFPLGRRGRCIECGGRAYRQYEGVDRKVGVQECLACGAEQRYPIAVVRSRAPPPVITLERNGRVFVPGGKPVSPVVKAPVSQRGVTKGKGAEPAQAPKPAKIPKGQTGKPKPADGKPKAQATKAKAGVSATGGRQAKPTGKPSLVVGVGALRPEVNYYDFWTSQVREALAKVRGPIAGHGNTVLTDGRVSDRIEESEVRRQIDALRAARAPGGVKTGGAPPQGSRVSLPAVYPRPYAVVARPQELAATTLPIASFPLTSASGAPAAGPTAPAVLASAGDVALALALEAINSENERKAHSSSNQAPLGKEARDDARAYLGANAELTAFLTEFAIFKARTPALAAFLSGKGRTWMKENRPKWDAVRRMQELTRAVGVAMVPSAEEKQVRQHWKGGPINKQMHKASGVAEGNLGWRGWRLLGGKDVKLPKLSSK